MSDSLRTHGLQPARLLSTWDFPGKNTAVDSHFLLQGIFLTQRSNLSPLHCRQFLYHLSHHICKPKHNIPSAKINNGVENMICLFFFSLLFNSWYVLIRIPAGLHTAFGCYVSSVLLVYRFIFLLFIFLAIY